jgi:hypothetical protein
VPSSGDELAQLVIRITQRIGNDYDVQLSLRTPQFTRKFGRIRTIDKDYANFSTPSDPGVRLTRISNINEAIVVRYPSQKVAQAWGESRL